MHVQTITVGSIGENTYILDGGSSYVLIDPGADEARISAALQSDKPVEAVLLTHAHFDHIGAVAYFRQKGAAVYLHKDDADLLQNGGTLADMFGQPLSPFTPDVLLQGGEALSFGTLSIRVLHTPGHTDGSVCYLTDGLLFSGDTLFYLSVGRTDFPTGSAARLRRSLDMLFALPQEYEVLPGHGERTLLSFEKKNNPYV